jgi:hypothetical protein
MPLDSQSQKPFGKCFAMDLSDNAMFYLLALASRFEREPSRTVPIA